MSDYGEEIINRMNSNSSLHNKDNPMRKIILNTIGEWLEKYDAQDFYEQFFLATAKEDYLDLQGIQYGVYRKTGEDDESYLKRIIYETLNHITPDYVENLCDCSVYVNTDGMLIPTNQYYHSDVPLAKLTSKNPYINSEDGYFILARNWGTYRKIMELQKKMVLGNKLILSRVLPIEI